MTWNRTTLSVLDGTGTSQTLIEYSDGTNLSPLVNLCDNTGAIISPALAGAQKTATVTAQNAATANGNGTVATTDGYDGSLNLLISNGAGSCTVFIEGSFDNFATSQDVMQVGVVLLATSSGTNTTHTLSYGNQSINYVASILGVNTYVPNATGGMRTARHGQVGHTAEGFFPPTCVPGTTGWTGFPIGGALCIHEDSLNDIGNATNLTTFGNAIDQKFRTMRRQNPNCSIIYVITSCPYSVTDDYSSGWSNQATAWQFHTQIEELANHHNAAIVNMHAKWGASGLPPLFANTVHPSVAGHADIANTVLSIL